MITKWDKQQVFGLALCCVLNHREISDHTSTFIRLCASLSQLKCKHLNRVTVLTWEEYEELQWVWKQQWWPAEFAPAQTGHRPLGRPLGLHCSVKARTERDTWWKRGAVRGQRATDWTGGCMAPTTGGTLWLSYRSDGLKAETKWSHKYSCLISKVHNLTPPRSSQVSIGGKCSAGSS